MFNFIFNRQSNLLSLLVLLILTAATVAGSLGMAFGSGPTTAWAQESSREETIRFSPPARLTNQALRVTLTPLLPGTVRYTTDGSLPDANSPIYNQPLSITSSTVIRAQVFDEAGHPLGDVDTRSYLVVSYQQTIPVISIVSDWAHLNTLHDYPAERYQNRDYPVAIEYFAPGGQLQFQKKANLHIHGSKPRLYATKKSYLVSFQPDSLAYPLFDDSPVTTFDRLVLRAAFNDTLAHTDVSGREPHIYAAHYIGDQVIRNLHRDMGQPAAHGRWVLLYLNGEYWGLYNLIEEIDRQYFRSYAGRDSEWDIIEKKEGRTIENEWLTGEVVVAGDSDGWQETQTWITHTDFTDPANIVTLESRVDLENLFSNLFLQAYVQNDDWPDNHWLIYRRSDLKSGDDETRWRLMVGDALYSFGSGRGSFKTDVNTFKRIYSSNDSLTPLLKKAVGDNCQLTARFVQRSYEYLGVTDLEEKGATEVGQLSKERVKAEILAQAAVVRPFVVFINLINNASYAMQALQGDAHLTITSQLAPSIFCHQSQVEPVIRIAIRDTGPGISPEQLPRIFDPFFTTKTVGEGLGLGLSICHGIIREHGGHIWAESDPGEGSAFFIELPVVGLEATEADG